MSDPLKFDWTDALKAFGGLVLTVAMRLVFGRAMSAIDRKLTALSELKAIQDELAACRTDIRVLKDEVENLKRLPVPVGSPR